MAIQMLDHTELDGQLAGLLDAPNWYMGFSGGVDSTVLLHLLHRWCKANPGAPTLSAIHINHNMQADAADWQRHCEWVAKMLPVPLVAREVAVEPDSRGPEAAAREARYAVFEQLLQWDDVLFLGHHLDDQVETFFLRLLRGAGVQGLAAIPARRTLGEGQLVRPLLQVPRQALEDYAAEHGLQCIEDPSNSDTAMDRNFLRSELLPLVASRWPGYRRTVSRASEHMAGAVTALQQALPTPETVYSEMGDAGIALEELTGVTLEAAAVKLRSWLQAVACLPPDQLALEEFLRQLRGAAADASPRLECSAYALQRYGDGVYLPGILDEPAVPPFTLTGGECYQVPGVGAVCLDRAPGEGLLLAPGEYLSVRWRQGGERCKPGGRDGSNSLKKLLQQYRVPPWWRDRVPLFYLDEELLAVGDLWLCESSRWRACAGRGEQLWRPRWNRNTGASFD